MAAPAYAVPNSFGGAALPKVWKAPIERSRFGDVVLVIFLLAQCFDGVLTYVGVVTYGVSIEANPLITTLMAHLGHGTALMTAKVTAGLLGIALHLRNVHGAVAALACFYVTVAILPWMAILFF
jgi:uncharacterized membrane protein